ncbi:hypothetical protein TREMEDRAFT_40176 [Tremella mesenterica DSM 1558]|uniref:uncharacterized protein n=1 Tax=Tremella mesenterica (strain ATCC 24925 / CBS 8224 / DSM 1558 / NBRC 9311 / NRRL Y-6157 / RJB 2259-6 / UBC 559-6) TaxID=578456 RepID=UPI0003F49DA0|nr:uncharacterized protein TREMEDRAFT_40176 [Tremella mesenterica DSM 1558]EIW68079.1 hypothetical protein TREMEDRAFT_40176 [Tremella mesenterica DSM 1558]
MAVIEEGSDLDVLFQSFIMIVVSEIGDKTFLIAAIMATRHPRITVFGGAFASLVVMSILSAALGRVILGFIPKVWTLWAAAILFLVFGIKMLQEGLTMSSGSSHIQDEMREVEEELEEDASRHDFHNSTSSSIPLEALEEGKFTSDMPSSPSSRYNPVAHSRSASPKPRGPSILFPTPNGVGPVKEKGRHWVSRVSEGARNAIQVLTNPVFAQAFILTFLGEWGDRSQITTIAMGGAHSVPVIAFGTIVGHGVCTLGAVMGGRYLSTKISVKHITLIGAAAFLIFALLYIREAWVTPYSDVPEVPAGWR